VHTIPYSSTLLHASHLILATSSSRVFLRNPGINVSPPLSPTPSLSTSQSSPPSSPSIASLSLTERSPLTDRLAHPTHTGSSKLPPPPPTQLSPHYVVSTVDILSALAKAYSNQLSPPSGVTWPNAMTLGPDKPVTDPKIVAPGIDEFGGDASPLGTSAGAGGAGGYMQGWELDPTGLSKRRRASSSAGGTTVLGDERGFESWRWAGRVGRG
jgi:hypothetical protein